MQGVWHRGGSLKRGAPEQQKNMVNLYSVVCMRHRAIVIERTRLRVDRGYGRWSVWGGHLLRPFWFW